MIKTVRFLKRLFARKIVIFGVALVIFFVFCAIFAPLLTPYGSNQQDISNPLAKPNAEHILGTDAVGRDILTRLLYGAQTSLMIGIVAVSLSAVCGVLLGLVAGYFGGLINSIISRIMDAMMSIPSIMLAIALGIIFGGGLVNLMIILGLSTIPTYTRMMSAQVISVRNADYIDAERALGAGSGRILFSHVLPNCISPIIVLITQNIGMTILAEASLSFLGLGITPPMASWGSMINEGYAKIMTSPVFGIAPGLCIMLLVLGFNLFGDGLRDALDPRLRGKL